MELEMKFLRKYPVGNLSVNVQNFTASSDANLCMIEQGTGPERRIGLVAYVHRMEYRIVYQFKSLLGASLTAIPLCQWWLVLDNSPQGTVPTTSDIFSGASIGDTLPNPYYLDRFTILDAGILEFPVAGQVHQANFKEGTITMTDHLVADINRRFHFTGANGGIAECQSHAIYLYAAAPRDSNSAYGTPSIAANIQFFFTDEE